MLCNSVNSDGRDGLFVLRDSLEKKRRWRSVLLFGFRNSPLSTVFLSSVKPCYSSPQRLSPKLTVVFWKGSVHVRLGSRSHPSLLCTLALSLPSFCFSPGLTPPLPLLFSPSGLYHQRGEMAPGQLWRYSGNVCRRGSRGGKIFIPPSHLVQTFISTISIPYWHVTCMS